jgi:hypothetical protein
MSVETRHRICPLPIKWDDFYRLIGAPKDLGPLILSGWAFSTHRQKRERFRAQVEHAYNIGLQQDADRFLSGLRDDEWFYCSEGSLDFDYGESLREEFQEIAAREEEARQEVRAARLYYAELRHLRPSDGIAPDNLVCFLDRWSSRFSFLGGSRIEERIEAIEESLLSDEQAEWDQPAPECVEEQLEAFKVNLRIELLMLKLLRCQSSCRNLDEDADFWREVLRNDIPEAG